jgi:hypothetical protein
MKLVKTKLILFAIAFTVLVGLLLGWNYIKTSPQYSLFRMYKTIEAHDYEAFTKYVDVDSLVDNIVEKVLKETEDETTDTQGDAWAELGKSLAEGFISLMKPKLKEEAKIQIKRQIESGEFKKDYQPKNIFKAITSTKVKRDGKVADVILVNEPGDELKLKMRQKDGYWQVFDMDFELESTSEKTEENTQQLKFGERVDIGGNWFLTVGEPILYQSTDVWEKPKEGYRLVATEITYENTSQNRGYFSLSNLKIKDTDNHSYSESIFGGKEPRLQSDDLEAGGKVKGFVSFEILEDAEIQSIVYSGTYKTIVFTK